MSPDRSSGQRLRPGSLRTLDALFHSIALLALVMGTALSTSFAASSAGAATPLAFFLTGLACLCLGYVVIQFTRQRASAGSVYIYITQGLGPHAGFIGGWMYAGAFACGTAFVLAIASHFLSVFLATVHLSLDWLLLYNVLLGLLFCCAFFGVRLATRIQLVLAAAGILSVVILAVRILVKGGAAGFSLTPFSPAALPQGLSSLLSATLFSFTSFIGFEAAAVLGEETINPRVSIPRAILSAVIAAVLYYVLVTFAMSLGYGVTHAPVWAQDAAPLDTLARRYTTAGFATWLDLMVALDAFVAALAGLQLTARVLYRIGRDGGLPAVFARTHPRFHTPWGGLVGVVMLTLCLGITLGRSMGVFTFFGFLATVGSLGVLLAYLLVALSGMVFFGVRGMRTPQERSWRRRACDVLLPLLAIVVCGATISGSVIPVPAPPLQYAPSVAGAWLLCGLGLMLWLWWRRPASVAQLGQRLTSETEEHASPPALVSTSREGSEHP